MTRSALIGVLCGLLLVSPALACNPCFVRRAVVNTYIAPAVPVVPVSTVLIAQFAPTYLTVPTFSVGSVGYGVGGVGAVPGAGIAPPIGPAGAPVLPASGTPPAQPGNGPQPGGMSSGGNQPAAPSENERILALLSAMEARLTALEAKLPPAQPPPAAEPAKTPEKPAGPPAPGGEKQSRATTHQPSLLLAKCINCHRGSGAEGGLDLSAGLERLTSSQLFRVSARVSNGSMPPRKQQAQHPPLTLTELQEMVARVQYLQQTARR